MIWGGSRVLERQRWPLGVCLGRLAGRLLSEKGTIISDKRTREARTAYEDWGYAVIRETNVVTFSQNLDEMISQVQFSRDSIVINKDGCAIAVLIDAKLFERMRERFDALAARFADAYSEVPEEAGMAEIQRVVAAERGKTENLR